MQKLIFIFLFVFTFFANAQNDPEWNEGTDKKLIANKSDSEKLDFYKKTFYRYTGNDYSKASVLGKKALQLANTLNRKDVEAEMLMRIGQVEYVIGNYEKALTNYIASVKLFQRLNDKSKVAEVYNEIAVLHRKNNDLVKSKEYIAEAMAIYEDNYDTNGVATTFNNLGITSEIEQNPLQALSYYRKALNLYVKTGCELCISYSFNYIAGIYSILQRFDSALVYETKSLELRRKIDNKFMIVQSINSLGEIYFKKSNYNQSIKFFLEGASLAYSLKFVDYEKMAYDFLSRSYEKIHNYEQAYKYHVLYFKLNDSLFNISRFAQISELQTRYETEKKETKIKLLNQSEQLNKLAINEQRVQIQKRNYLLGGVSLLFILLVIAGYIFNSRQKLNNSLARIKAIKDTEDSERLRIATDIHDELGSGLSKINFLSEVIYTKPSEASANFASIAETSKALVENMRDMIWALNPENTTLDNLIARMREYSTDYLSDFPIELKSIYPDEIESIQIQKETHRHIFLIIKEALNNIVKHASATYVEIKVTFSESLNICIQDNGKGFQTDLASNGNGLKNMLHRISAVEGKLIIKSGIGDGTNLFIVIPIDKMKMIVTKSEMKG